MNITNYLEKVNDHFNSGHATEHTYRGDFAALIQSLAPSVHVTNEPSNVTDCGNPDYVITKKKIPVGFIEAKDLGKDLNSKQYKEQFGRYRKALDNLIITDYIWFQFFQNGNLVHEVRIAEVDGNKVKALPENFDKFTNLILDFCDFIAQTIKSSKTLAEMMAAKARLLENILENAITSDEENEENTTLKQQYETFKNILIHDLTPQGFSDIYAQTLAYGMFAARLHDKTLDTFSRQEAAELIPKSNPFLRKLFSHVAGVDIDERIVTTVDNLADVFRATNVEALLKNLGKSTQSRDPVIHFYETFLAEYDPKLRKARGVWYTPEPVVRFIVRGVDVILKKKFGLKEGLTDTSKISIEVEAQGTSVTKGKGKGARLTETKEVHKVQILDPATGTGTFLAEVVKYIYSQKFQSMQGVWSGYIEEHLIPRLNGFELLMASYSMAHLKLDMLLTETGYKSKKNPRFNIFLTNSLEEHHPDTGTLFSTWLSAEANEANSVKRDAPIMCVIGNPPYSGVSSNNGEWISGLIEDYKYVDGEHFNERKHWLNDDYVKFLRYGQHFVEKNGSGVLAFINPHGFLDNPTFRGMRWNLLKTYDEIYTIDLHGNSTKKEVSPDGSADQNVFDIMQGVAITFFVKTGNKNKDQLGEVFHFDLFGRRDYKYDFLDANKVDDIPFKKLAPESPNFFFVPKDTTLLECYNKGLIISELFNIQSMGVTSARDNFVVDIDRTALAERVGEFCNKQLSTSDFQSKYKLKENYQWKVGEQRSASPEYSNLFIKNISYRPFDVRHIYYQDNLVFRMRGEVMSNFEKENLALCASKLGRNADYHNYFITNNITDKNIISSLDNANIFPLYVYVNSGQQGSITQDLERVPNLDAGVVKEIENRIGLSFSCEDSEEGKVFLPVDILDYIYAVLYSPSYREKYKEFLKIDFPRVPYPRSRDVFFRLKKLGSELRNIHLLESPKLNDFIVSYPVHGDNQVVNNIVKKDWELRGGAMDLVRVYINSDQYFDDIPIEAWSLYIGGYQPAQKWLKDRVGRRLTFDDIVHYQKIIVALNETHRIMREIDEVDFD